MKPARSETAFQPAIDGRVKGTGSACELPCPMLQLNSRVPLKELW